MHSLRIYSVIRNDSSTYTLYQPRTNIGTLAVRKVERTSEETIWQPISENPRMTSSFRVLMSPQLKLIKLGRLLQKTSNYSAEDILSISRKYIVHYYVGSKISESHRHGNLEVMTRYGGINNTKNQPEPCDMILSKRRCISVTTLNSEKLNSKTKILVKHFPSFLYGPWSWYGE